MGILILPNTGAPISSLSKVSLLKCILDGSIHMKVKHSQLMMIEVKIVAPFEGGMKGMLHVWT